MRERERERRERDRKEREKERERELAPKLNLPKLPDTDAGRTRRCTGHSHLTHRPAPANRQGDFLVLAVY